MMTSVRFGGVTVLNNGPEEPLMISVQGDRGIKLPGMTERIHPLPADAVNINGKIIGHSDAIGVLTRQLQGKESVSEEELRRTLTDTLVGNASDLDLSSSDDFWKGHFQELQNGLRDLLARGRVLFIAEESSDRDTNDEYARVEGPEA